MRKIVISSFLLFTLAFAAHAFAQDEQPKASESAKQAEPPVHYYHLDFVVQEVGENGKPVNSRSYSCTVSTAYQEEDQVRIGSRVPMATGSAPSGSEPVNVQYQFEDVGVNFDVRAVREIGNKLAMHLGAEVTGTGAGVHLGGANGVLVPVKNHNTWRTPVFIPIGKPTVVFTSDDIGSKGGMQVVVTATLLQ